MITDETREGLYTEGQWQAIFSTLPTKVDEEKFRREILVKALCLQLRNYAKLFNEQRQNASSNRGPTFAPAVFAKHPGNNGINKDAFEAAMQRLLISNTIRIEQFGPPSHLRTRLVLT